MRGNVIGSGGTPLKPALRPRPSRLLLAGRALVMVGRTRHSAAPRRPLTRASSADRIARRRPSTSTLSADEACRCVELDFLEVLCVPWRACEAAGRRVLAHLKQSAATPSGPADCARRGDASLLPEAANGCWPTPGGT
ncbi:hypothetical protein GCM10020229_15490 [Kitasatospora albolonga]